jgi:hypothetical protein
LDCVAAAVVEDVFDVDLILKETKAFGQPQTIHTRPRIVDIAPIAAGQPKERSPPCCCNWSVCNFTFPACSRLSCATTSNEKKERRKTNALGWILLSLDSFYYYVSSF